MVLWYDWLEDMHVTDTLKVMLQSPVHFDRSELLSVINILPAVETTQSYITLDYQDWSSFRWKYN